MSKKRRVGICPKCGNHVGVTSLGTVVRHNQSILIHNGQTNKIHRVRCGGSHQAEATP